MKSLYLYCPKTVCKNIRTSLENENIYDFSRTVSSSVPSGIPSNYISLPITLSNFEELLKNAKTSFLQLTDYKQLGLEKTELLLYIGMAERLEPFRRKDTLGDVIKRFLTQYPSKSPSSPAILFNNLPKGWTVYYPLVLLPSYSFASSAWQSYLDNLSQETRDEFFGEIAKFYGVSHIAVNMPIPNRDLLRRPDNIKVLFGDFGPQLDFSAVPTREDFENAFWVSTTQHKIRQIWAPRYTMFSRGNTTEKSRIMRFPQIRDEVIVDLYAGIGYFAFSYVAAGAKQVICWELNPWSIEGMRRGALENKWTIRVVPPDEEVNLEEETSKLVIYMEDNCHAERRLGNVHASHINLGLLPDCRKMWKTSARMITTSKPAWLHIHENVCENKVTQWEKEVQQFFQNCKGPQWTVTVDHVEKVKSYSPHVYHLVADVYFTFVPQ